MHTVVSYSCATAAGDSTEDLWKVAVSGRDCSSPYGFLFTNRREGTDLELLTKKLLVAFQGMKDQAPAAAVQRLASGDKVGVILASTKGRVSDFIWSPNSMQLSEDPLTPVLSSVLWALELHRARSVVVSNACSSALAAVKLGQMWLDQGLDDVIILAGDVVSDFVRRGFSSLKLLSAKRPRPFAEGRDGFLLGEGAAAIWLSREGGDLGLAPVGLDSEGSAVTRPPSSSDSVVRAISKIPGVRIAVPDIVVAHGTATLINDLTEDRAFNTLFKGAKTPVPVTASKWAIGHTLGASGAVDLILAFEMLRRKESFPIHATDRVDPNLTMSYLLKGAQAPVNKRVLVTSLGFGGMHAAALVERL